MQAIIQMANTSPQIYIESRSYTTGYENRSSSDLKCGTRHRGYPGTGIMEGDCTHNPEDWKNESIKCKCGETF